MTPWVLSATDVEGHIFGHRSCAEPTLAAAAEVGELHEATYVLASSGAVVILYGRDADGSWSMITPETDAETAAEMCLWFDLTHHYRGRFSADADPGGQASHPLAHLPRRRGEGGRVDAAGAISLVAGWIRSRDLDYPTSDLVADRFEAGWSVYAPVEVDESDPMAFLDLPVGRSVFLVSDLGRIKEISSSLPPLQARDLFTAEEAFVRRGLPGQQAMAELAEGLMRHDPPVVSGFTLTDPPQEIIAARASGLLDPIAQRLALLGPPGWRRLAAVFSFTVSAEVAQLRFFSEGRYSEVLVPEEIALLVRRQRHLAARMPAGPWWRLLLTVTNSGQTAIDHDYGDQPLPDEHLLSPEHYRNDLEAYPRADIPAWLADYLADTDEDRETSTPADTAPDRVAALPRPEPSTGDVVAGRYRVGATVGQGGMGRVRRAEDLLLGREVALKEILLPTGIPVTERGQVLERVRREAQTAARLNHPGIVRVHDIIDHNGAPVIVMEYLDGPSLATVIRESGPLRPAEVARIASVIIDALAHAHAQGVIHRDLKPDNIVLTRDGRTVLTDFGIARPLDDATPLTAPGAVLGTPAYMAPEQIEGKTLTGAADFWSLGVTLYTALEGQPPFPGESITEICVAILTRAMRTPRNAGPLTPLLEALLVKDAAARATAHKATSCLAAIEKTTPIAPPTPEKAADTTPVQVAGERRHPHTGGPADPTNDTTASLGPEVAPTVVTDRPAGIEPGSGRGSWLIALVVTVVAAAIIIPVLLTTHHPRSHAAATGITSPKPSAPRTPGVAAKLTATLPADPEYHSTDALAFARNGATLAAADDSGIIDLWNTTTGKLTATLTDPGSQGVIALTFVPDSSLIVADANGSVYRWNTTTRKLTGSAKLAGGSTEWPNDEHPWAQFSPDGDVLLTTDSDASHAYLWNTTTGKLIAALTPPDNGDVTAAAFSPDGATLAIAETSGIYLRNAATGNPTGSVTTPDTYDVVGALAFNGTTLAIAQDNGKTYLWNTATRKITATLTAPVQDSNQVPGENTGDDTDLNSAAFAPNGALAISYDYDTYIWDTTLGKFTTVTNPEPSGFDPMAFNGTTLAIANDTTNLWRITQTPATPGDRGHQAVPTS